MSSENDLDLGTDEAVAAMAAQEEAEEAEAAATESAAGASAERRRNDLALVVGALVAGLLALVTIVICIAGAILVLGGQNSVSGTITYRERMALTPDAVVIVQIQDVSSADAPAEIIGEQIIHDPGQAPIAFEVDYDPRDLDDQHTYAIQARIEDGQGGLLFTTTQHYPVITHGNPTEDIEIVLEAVYSAQPPQLASYIRIDQPAPGAVLDTARPIVVTGWGGALPEGNIVVQVLDSNGNVLAQEPTIVQAPDAGTGGEGPWSVQLTVQAEPGTAGQIRAFSTSPLDGSLVAEDSVAVSLGKTEALPSYMEIDEPAEGAVLDISQPVAVSGRGAGLPEGNVVVQARDAAGNVLAEAATILQGRDVSTGGAGTWSLQLDVPQPSSEGGVIVAFSPSPLTGGFVASAMVNVSYSQAPTLEGITWVWEESLADNEATALFEDGRVTGSGGCNSYQGTYETGQAEGHNTLKIGPLAATMMMCDPAIMDQEDAFLSALQAATAYRLEDGSLVLEYPGGSLVFYNSGQPSPLR